MSTDSAAQIRQADNSIEVEGILKEISLEQRTTSSGNIVAGRIVILAGPNTEIDVDAYASELTKDNKPNPAYNGLRTVMQEYHSIAALMKSGLEYDAAVAQATRVRLGNRASLGRREYYNDKGDFISRVQLSSNYFNRVEPELCTPHATFEVEAYFDKIRREIKDDQETGRVLVETVIPMYGGRVLPFTFVAEGDVADYIQDNYEPKRTGRIWGDIRFTVERTETRKSGFGAARTKTETTYKRELVITGGEGETYDPESPRAFRPEAIQEAWKIRETEILPSLLQKSRDRTKAAPSQAPNFRMDSAYQVNPPATGTAANTHFVEPSTTTAVPQFKW